MRLRLRDDLREALAEAGKRKAEQSKSTPETAGEAFQRVWLASKWSDKEAQLYELAKTAYLDGSIGRLSEGRLTKREILDIGRKVEAERKQAERQRRIAEVLAEKPDNFYILTRDEQLPRFIERLREECRLQMKEWRDRFEILGVKSMTAGDFEGTGIDSYVDLSIGFSIWLPLLNEGYYLAYGHVDMRNYEGFEFLAEMDGMSEGVAFKDGDEQLTREKALDAIKPYLSEKSHGKTFHMGAARYDLHIAINDGYEISGCVWDTLDAMYLMNEHEPSYALKTLTQKYGKLMGVEADAVAFEDLFGNRSPAPFSTELVGIYAIKDVLFGWRLFEWQFGIMGERDRLLECYAEIDSRLPETDVFMERCGFVIDLDAAAQLEREFSDKLEQARQEVFETYGIDAEFVRKMDSVVSATKICNWVTAQKRKRENLRKRIEAKRAKVAELKAKDKTHTKGYANEVAMLERYERELLEMPEAIEANAPQFVESFELTNGNHIAYLIYDYLGIEDKTYVVDRSKKRSTSVNVMEIYFEDEPKLKPLANVSMYEKLLGTYLRPMLGKGVESSLEIDGRLHSNFKAGGTSTGRYSSSKYSGRPIEVYEYIKDAEYYEKVKALVSDNRRVSRGTNLQNIPARTDEGKRVRNCFVPRDGYIFVGSDLGQIEPRIQAHIMYTKYGDNSMRQIFVDGVDLYTTMAMKVFGLAEEYCVDKALDPTGTFSPRALMKLGILAKSYGQTPQAFARNLNVSLAVAELFFRNFDEQFPSFTQMVTDIREGMKRDGFVETLFGRKRRFPDYKRLASEVKRNEQKLMQYYIERKPLLTKKSRTAREERRLAELQRLIKPLADKRGLVAYWERAAFNAVIQGTGADILKKNGNRMARICKERGWEFNASIHDEVKVSVPKAELTRETIALIQDIMTNTVQLSVPLVTDTVIEPRWMEEYSPEEWDFEKCIPKGAVA